MCNRLHTRLRQGSSLVGYFLRRSDDFIVILALLVIAIVFFANAVSEKDVRRRFFRNEIQVNNLGTEFC